MRKGRTQLHDLEVDRATSEHGARSAVTSAASARSIAATIAVAGLIAAACTTGGDDGTAATTTAPTTTVVSEPRVADGRLSLGLLLPADAPLVADAIRSTALQVVDEVNEAGGVLGSDVSVQIADEGTSAAAATAATTELLDAGVDAIIGPVTATNAVTVIDIASASEIVTCSPTATAAILDDLPDDMLFFRTIASDSMQAEAIAESVDNTGARSVVIAFVDDAYGRPYGTAVAAGLERRSIDVVAQFGFTPDGVSDAVDEVLDAAADVLVVLAAGPELATVLAALGTTDPDAFDTVITNDAVRSAANQAVLAELPASLRDRLIGVAPQIIDRRIAAEPSVFAPQVADCVTLLALAAVRSDSDDPRSIASQMAAVSSGGRLCRSFEACVSIGPDRQIDYNGPTGLTELNRVGETSRAWFERFTIDDDGADQYADSGRLQVAI